MATEKLSHFEIETVNISLLKTYLIHPEALNNSSVTYHLKRQLEQIPKSVLLTLLVQRKIVQERGVLPGGILNVTSFLNHQIDPSLLEAIGMVVGRRFASKGPTKVLTIEDSGIGPAFSIAKALRVEEIFARRSKPITLTEIYESSAPSHTKGGIFPVIVGKETLGSSDRVLIVDDFLATGKTINALVEIVQQAKAEIVGIAVVIEKSFEGGRRFLEEQRGFSLSEIYSVVIIKSMDHQTGKIVFDSPQ